MTNEELDVARAAEACRLWKERNPEGYLTHANREMTEIAARLAREGWEPVDPIVLKAREIVADHFERRGMEAYAGKVRKGYQDRDAGMLIALKALKSCEP